MVKRTKIVIGRHLSLNLLEKLPNNLYIGNTFAFFSHSPRRFNPAAEEESKKRLDYILNKYNWIKRENLVIHSSYLINIANTISKEVFSNSVILLKREIEIADNLGVKFIVVHFGSTLNVSRQVALQKVVKGLDNVLCEKQKVMLLLETMSGKGTQIGNRFEDFKYVIENVRLPDLVGVCWDTCHLYSAGFDVKNKLNKVIKKFEDEVGLEKLRVIHINDSLNKLGSRLDNHANIGNGFIGLKYLKKIVHHFKLADKIKILETPLKNIRVVEEEIEGLINERRK